MLSKLKDKLKDLNIDDSNKQLPQRKIDISFLNEQQFKNFTGLVQEARQNFFALQEISSNNKKDIIQFIKQQEQSKSKNPAGGNKDQQNQSDDQTYTFAQDIIELKQICKDLQTQMKDLLNFTSQFKKKIASIQANQSADKVKSLELILQKKQEENRTFRKSEQNYKQILNTLTQQKQLYQNQTKTLQQKSSKIEKQLKQTTHLLNNLRQQKQVLLQMRNTDSVTKNPQVEGLKQQLSQFQKRLTLQKTKNQQKQKQIQNLRKKLDQDRQSLQKIADQLKQKQLKSKKIIDKYERSKIQIRKFRQQKNQFIKKTQFISCRFKLKMSKIQKIKY